MGRANLGIPQGYLCQSLGRRVHVGVALLQSGGAEGLACLARLQKHSYTKEQVIQTGLSIETGSSAASTGWQSVALPKPAQEHILELYESGQINTLLASFCPIECLRLSLSLITLFCSSC